MIFFHSAIQALTKITINLGSHESLGGQHATDALITPMTFTALLTAAYAEDGQMFSVSGVKMGSC